MNRYHIHVNGEVLSGESEEVEDADPPAMKRGWNHSCPRTRSGLVFGREPLEVVGCRNLKSWIDRLFARDIEIREIKVVRIIEQRGRRSNGGPSF